MTSQRRFEELIRKATGDATARENSEAEECLFVIANSVVHLRIDLRRNEIIMSTIVYWMNGSGEEFHPELIAEFNAFHLFEGGYRLSSQPASNSLFVSVVRSLEWLERMGLCEFLEEFLDRCVSCARWCAEQCGDVSHRSSMTPPYFITT